MGLSDTFEFFECIRETDTTELYRVSIYRSAIYIADWIIASCKAFLLYRCIIFKLQKCTKYKLPWKRYYNTVLLWYVFMPLMGHSLHFRTNVRLPERAYLMFPHLDPHFEFDTEFGKTLKNQHFHHFLYRQKSLKIASKYLSALIK